GFDIESKPNTKLSSDMYQVLLKEIQGDKNAKDEAKQNVSGKIRRDEPSVGTSSAASESSSTRRDPVSQSEEILMKNVSTPIVEKAPEPPAKEEKPAEASPLKVVGKIDLDNLGKGKSKKAEKVEEPKAPEQPQKEEVKPTPAAPIEEKVEVKAEEPKKAEEVASVEKAEPVKEEKEVVSKPKEEAVPVASSASTEESIPTRYAKLEGPKVIGKIELPDVKSKDKVGSSSSGGQDNKRKRKRTNKLGTAVSPTQGGQNRPGGGQGRPDNRAGSGRQQGRRHDSKGRGRADAPKEELTEKEIQDQIKATLARLSGAGKSGKFAQRAKLRRQKRDDIALSAEEAALEQEMMSKVLRVTEFVTANE